MPALARWCLAHRRLVVVAWIVALVGISAIHGAAGSAYSDSFSLKGTESTDARALLQRSAPTAAGDSDRIVMAVRSGHITDPAVRARISGVLAQVAKLPHVAAVVSPFAAASKGQVSRDGRVAFAQLNFDQDANYLQADDVKRVVHVAQSVGNGVQVELGGQAIQLANRQSPGGLGIGILVAAIVLLIAFGSLLAAALPLLAAVVSLGTAVGVIGLLSHAITMAQFSSQLALLIGLGVGVDYALFIVTRYRQGLQRGLDEEHALVQAINTAGRAVLFAGITVCIALLGMFVLGVSFLYGAAIAASLAVAFTVVSALTLLPALLGFFGTRVLTKRQRVALGAGELTENDESPGWARWAAVIDRRPALLALAAALVMLLIAVPFLSLRLGSSDQGSDPSSTTTRKAYDLLAQGFGPGFNGPLQLVASISGPAQQAAFKAVVDRVAKDPDVTATTAPAILRGGGSAPPVAVAQVIPKGSPQDASTTDLLHRLRADVLPQAAGDRVHVLVGGQTAIFEDFAGVLSGKLPLFIAVVVALSFLLLTAVFRSLLIPAMAAIMNLLSVAASFGVVTAVFQWGWLAGLIGVDRTGPIEAFLPVMVFAILFGLSMDYEVFLVSRIYEEWQKRGDNRQAVLHGLAATGRTITAAAAIMVLVFAAFILGGERVIKLFGVGLAGAVFLDALIVRSVLIPGLMLMVGKANWALPRWLDRRLPQIHIEAAEDHA